MKNFENLDLENRIKLYNNNSKKYNEINTRKKIQKKNNLKKNVNISLLIMII